MNPARLCHMADQIARNFAAQGDESAIAATADHIRLYWDPRMKAAIRSVDRSSLSPIAAAAVERV
jgi:formate dehydrogenase subunit delta